MTTTSQRPPQVVSACLFLGASCALLLLNLVLYLVSWNTAEVRDQVDRLFEAIGSSATDAGVESLRLGLQVFVPILVTGLVCAVYAARGQRGARIVLTVVSAVTVPGFLLTAGSFLAVLPVAVVGYSVAQLWSRSATRWYAGEAPATSAPEPTREPDPFAARSPVRPTEPPSAAPFAVPLPPPTSGVPRDVRTIDLVVSIGGGLTALGSAAYLAVYLLAYDALIRIQLESPGRSMIDATDDELIAGVRGAAALAAVALLASVVALVAVRLLVRRQRLGHLLLTVVAGVTVPVGVLTLIGIPWAGVAVWVLVLLRRPSARGWVTQPDG